ncbi:hypothetical protein SDC9_17001 [bioreactor metagenome]|uniref:Uncharacterized protein n=1 Tax=bioreactor metagenome TaxID=1076179 RepID=A0A644TW66_9ZZZZ
MAHAKIRWAAGHTGALHMEKNVGSTAARGAVSRAPAGSALCVAGGDAIGIVMHRAVGLGLLHEAVDVGLEARAFAREFAVELEVFDDARVEHLARDQQRDAGRIGGDERGGDTALEIVDRHPLGGAARDMGEGVRGFHRRGQVAQIDLGGQPRNVILGVKRVHMGAEVAQAHVFIARLLGAELGHDAPHRVVLLVIVLELLQRGQQRVPAALGDADGEHDEEGIEPGLFHHHAMLGEVFRHDRGRDAPILEPAVEVQPGGDDRRLDRVEHVEPGRHVAKAVPAVLAVRGVDAIGIGAAQHPVLGAADAFLGQLLGAPDLEPPVVVAVFLVDLAHRAAEIERLHDALFHQRLAARRLHHRRGDVAARDDRVLRAGRGVHQVGFVEEMAVELGLFAVLHEHVACLADAGEELVNRLRGVDDRGAGARPLAAHRVILAVERVEGRMRQPGLVEMQVLDPAVEQGLDDLGVVEHAVIGRLRQRHDPRLHRVGVIVPEQRVRPDLGADRLGVEFRALDRADDAPVVARGFQEHRDRAGHDDRVQDRLVAVAVDHHHIARRHGVVPDHLVRGRGAVGDKETVVGVEDPRGVALGGADRAVVVQKLAQFLDRVAHVGAQHVLAVELVIHLPDRRFQEGDAARMPRAVPRVGPVLGIVEQGAEERRLDRLEIALRLADDVLGDELGGVLEHVDEAVQLAQDVIGQVPRGLRLAIDVDRHLGVLPAHLLDEVAQVHHRRVEIGAGGEFLVVDRQQEG